MSLFKKVLEVGAQAYCVPHSQRQWIQQYLTLLSANRDIDQEKAWRLELILNSDPSEQSSNKLPSRARSNGFNDLPPAIGDN